MKRALFKFAVGCATLILSAASPLSAQQSSAIISEQSNRSSSSITGRVIGDDGQPLANVAISVTPLRTGGVSFTAIRNVTTDAEGNFTADSLTAGLYSINAYSPGYISEANLTGMPLDSDGRYYRPGDSVTIRMIRGGVITGRVLNATGDPIPGIRVAVMRVRDREGKTARGWGGAMARTTDDRGVYRLYGLMPGGYLVFAGGSPGSPLSPFSGDTRTFYPSATRDTAAELTIQSGEEISGIDVRYRGELGHVVSGSFSFPAGMEGLRERTEVSLISIVTGAVEGRAMRNPMDNSKGFAIYGVADGEYELTAFSSAPEQNSLMSTRRRVTVAGRDVTGVEITLTPLASLAGKVVIEKNESGAEARKACQPARAIPLQEMLIAARRADESRNDELLRSVFYYNLRQEAPNQQGEFRLGNLVPGRYHLVPQLLSDNWYLITITRSASNQKPSARSTAPDDPARHGLLLKSGEQMTGVVVTLAEGAAALRGKVVAENAKLPARLQVQLVPAEKDSADDLLRYQETQAAGDGAFSLSNLAPGKYWLLARAVSDNESNERQARPLALSSSERAKLRREAETANILIELQPCQQVTDYTLKYPPRQEK